MDVRRVLVFAVMVAVGTSAGGDAAARSIWARYKSFFNHMVKQAEDLDLYGLTAQLPQGAFSFKTDWNMRRATGRYDKQGEKTPLVQPISFGDEKDPMLLLDLGASGAGGGVTMQFSYGVTDPLDFYLELPFQYMDVQVRPKLRRLSLLTAAMINGMLPAGYPQIDPNWFQNGATKEAYLNQASAWFIDYLQRLGRPSLGETKGYPADLGPGTSYNSDGLVLADINCGFSWNFFRSSRWSGAFTGRVFFPTGNLPDPNNAFTLGTGAELPRGTGSFGLGFTQGYDVRIFRYKYWLDIVLSGEFTASYYFESRRQYPSFPKPTEDGIGLLDLLDPDRLYFPDMSDLTGKSFGYTPGLGINGLATLSVSSLIFSVGVAVGYLYFQEPEYDADPRFVSMVRNLELELAGSGQALRVSASVLLVPLYIPGQLSYQYEHSLGGRNMLIFDRNHWVTFKIFIPTVF
jgi:hypothetical protein